MAEIYKRPGHLEVTIADEGKSREEIYNERAFTLAVAPSPELVELFEEHGITRRGKYAWAVSSNAEGHGKFRRFYQDYQDTFTPNTLHSGESNTFLTRMLSAPDRAHSQPLAFTQSLISRDYFEDEYYRVARNRRNMRILPPREVAREFFGVDNVYDVANEIIGAHLVKGAYREMFSLLDTDNPQDVATGMETFKDNFSPFVLVMELKRGMLWIRLKFINFDSRATDFIHARRGIAEKVTEASMADISDSISGIIYNGSKVANTELLQVHELLSAVNRLTQKYNGLFDAASMQRLELIRENVTDTIFVSNSFSDPNRADVINASGNMMRLSVPGRTKRMAVGGYDMRTMSVTDAIGLQGENEELGFEVVAHPALFDIQRMINSREFTEETRLYGYQRRAVGLQLSTELGFVNAMDTGIGKSIVQLSAMRHRAKTTENYRGIIACQANTIEQWKEYMVNDEWFPEATIALVNSGKKALELENALATEGPVVVLITFNMLAQVTEIIQRRGEMKEAMDNLTGEELFTFLREYQEEISEDATVGELIVDAHWHDVCADEATAIRNDFSSKQSQALWHVRLNGDVATALTATPFNKEMADIERLLAWVRNDRRLFHGASLASQYDAENLTEKDAKRIFSTLYPMVFRFTKEEAVAEEEGKIKIPEEKEPVSILLKPTAAELALSQACEYELKRIITELEEALNAYEAKTDAEKEELATAREELRNAHGHWLTGTNIARMATSNPSSILNSSSVAAQLLIGQGLVEAAMKDTPTKQKKLLEMVARNVSDGKQALVFTDFVDVADSLEKAMEEAGIRAGVFGGKNLKKRDENRIAFQAGELDVLICTKAAERGLTLHRASVTYHYDLSWTLEPLLQKAGRAARVGSENESVETIFLILEGTIEEKVVKQVFTQGTLSSMVLDKSRGVDIKNTTTGKLMGGLMSTNSNINTRKGALEFGKALLGS